jgi:selenocysteine lyase/cysteine desulfurase
VDDEGFIDLKEMETLLCAYNQKGQYGKKRIKLVAVSGASNVLGVFSNLPEISRIVHQYGARLLVDGAQMVAHCKVEVEKCGIDYFAFSAHKVYAPFGCGALVAKKGLLDNSVGGTEQIHSSGEENTVGIAALGKALVLLKRIGMEVIREEESALTRRVLSGMARINGLKIHGVKNPGSPGFAHKFGVVVFSLKSAFPDKVAKALAEQGGIGVRYGCHCAHILIKHILRVSPFLKGLQRVMQTLFPKLRFPGVTRVSLGIENSEEDIDRLINVLGKIARQPRNLPKTDMPQQMKDFTRNAAQGVYGDSFQGNL